jgi:predicted phage replisome organizer
MAKRYYWLKLPDNFFRQKPIKKLRKIAGGDTFTIIYLKMLLVAMKQDGKLYFEGVEEDFATEIALDLDEDIENVKLTVAFLLRQGLMEIRDDVEYTLTECGKMVGSESSSAERMRRLRDKGASHCDTDVTQSDVCVTRPLRLSDVEKEKEKEIEKDYKVSKDTFCPEPSSKASEPKPKKVKPAEPEAPVEELPLNDGTVWRPTVSMYEEYKRLYPSVDIDQEFRNMRGWCIGNPAKRKTRGGIKRFVTNWLSKEQNSARRGRSSGDVRFQSTEEYMQATAGWEQT